MSKKMIEPLIAHRGATAYAPENTIAAFDKAMAMGAKMIEFDVMLSQDGEPFVIHDDDLKRTTKSKGKVGEVDADYLRSLDAGSWYNKSFKGEPIPHFEEALRWLIFSNMKANIEIKPFPGTADQTTLAVMTALNRLWPSTIPMPLLSSFDRSVLQLCRNLAPEIPLALLMHEWDEQWSRVAADLAVYSIHVHHRVLTAERVKDMLSQGYKVASYTVNRKRLAKKLFSWGVDSIFSDYPDLLS
jgi:glycerophosphoryl diester phosphodiesterase